MLLHNGVDVTAEVGGGKAQLSTCAIMTEKYQNQEQDRRIVDLEKKMDAVFGHIAKTNEEMGHIKTDVGWLKKFFWVVASASVGGLIATLLNLLITIKK